MSVVRHMARTLSPWRQVVRAAPDPIFGLTERFNNDDSTDKVLLGVGAYRGGDGKPYILESVREAEMDIFSNNTVHEYSGILGSANFRTYILDFIYGNNCYPLEENRIAFAQTVSGTGSLRIATQMHKQCGYDKIYVPNPTWANHKQIFDAIGLKTCEYRYVKDNKLNIEDLCHDLHLIPDNSLVLMHACAHNPTGLDPTHEEWDTIEEAVRDKSHNVIFDMAYQGFATGDLDNDAYAVRHFAEKGNYITVCTSYSKNFGLYGHRVGSLSMITTDEEEKVNLESQLKSMIRPMYSNPPIHGANIVCAILGDDELTDMWLNDLKGMVKRIVDMRQDLVDELISQGSTRDWSHLVRQVGMFGFSGLTKDEVCELEKKYHIYMPESGRINIAGITAKNVAYVADSIHKVTSK